MKMMKMALASLAALMGLSCFALRTVSIAEQTSTGVTFAFGSQDGFSYELFMATGATDGGDDKYAWETFEKVTDVAYNQTSFAYEVPAAYRDGRHLHFFLMQTKNLNMAGELASVRSTGQQYVLTGIDPNGRTCVDFRFGKVAYANATAFFGRAWNGSQYLFNQQSDKFYFHGKSDVAINTKPSATLDYRFLIDDDNRMYLTSPGNASINFNVYDGNLRAINGSGNIAIFGCNNGGNLSTFTFYRMKIARAAENNGLLYRDLIPAVDANGVPGLYDNVNDWFYASKTAVPLVAGEARPAARFGRVVDETPTFRFRRSVAVAAIADDVVTLAFGNADGKTYGLYVASGTSDQGEDKNAWTAFEKIADIAGDDTTYEYTLPAALKQAGTVYRFFLVQTTDLPYAQELASIKSTNGQTIRTDYIPGLDTLVDLRLGEISYVNGTTFFGQSWQGYNYLFNMQGSTQFYFHSAGNAFNTIEANKDYRFETRKGGEIVISSATQQWRYSGISYAAPQTYPMAIFGCYSISRGSIWRFYSMVIRDNGLVVRDYVPVQTTDGKGALYDRANDKLYTNLTATDFTKGAALARQGRVVGSSLTQGADGAAIPNDVTLTEDTDWTAMGARIPSALNVDLNGYTLKLTADATKEITFVGKAGTLDLTVPSATTFSLGRLHFTTQPSKFIKRGAGTLELSCSFTGCRDIVVEEGVLKNASIGTVASGNTITVKSGAAYDVAGVKDSPVKLVLEGTGPDGLGALRNTGAAIGNGSAQLAGITLAGDATVNDANDYGILNSGYNAATFELNGHTLTLNSSNKDARFWMCTATGSSAGTILVKSGILFFYKSDKVTSLPNVDVVIDGPNAKFHLDSASKITLRDVTVQNGGWLYNGTNKCYLQNFTVLDTNATTAPQFTGGVAWWYVAKNVIVSNDLHDVTFYPPICDNGGSYSKLWKYGSKKLILANNHSDQRMDKGVEIFGGTVVMDSTHSSKNYHVAISSQPVPVIIHNGGTLDMTKCTAAFQVKSLQLDEGGTLLHTADNVLQIAQANTYTQVPAFTFNGYLRFTQPSVFDVTELFAGADAPAAGATTTLVSCRAFTGTGSSFNVTGCPYDADVLLYLDRIVLKTKTAAQSALTPIKIFCLGGNYVWGVATGGTFNFHMPLARDLAAEGWNVKMTGWRTDQWYAPNMNHSLSGTAADAWRGHSGILDLALKTTATRAGVLEGLEQYCATAEYPDFTVFCCGDTDVADGVADATIFINYTNAISRIKSALPMTTVLASSIPGASAALNTQISTWCATEADVEYIDLAAVYAAKGTGITQAGAEAAAGALAAKIQTLATPAGKNTPSSWTPPEVKLGATNNVPADYLAGFTHVRTMEPAAKQNYNFNPQNVYMIPYTYEPIMRETGIVKAGYYIELVRADSGEHEAMWIDMDAPGSNWADVAMPVTPAQLKQQVVNKLHVWSTSRAVRQVLPTDDSVTGYIEWGCLNYGGGDRTATGVLAEPWTGNPCGFNDTLNTSGTAGHGCWQFFRKFANGEDPLGAEVLFAYNRWGGTSAVPNAIGFGTFANFGNNGYSTSKEIDRTFCYGDPGTDWAKICSLAYSKIRFEFWVKYENDTPVSRADLANYSWSPADGSLDFWTAANWKKGETACANVDFVTFRIPEGVNLVPTYQNHDNVTHWATSFMIDGTLSLCTVGGFYNNKFDIGPTGKLIIDPTRFCWRLRSPPTFQPGAKLALAPQFANSTNGRFLICYWNAGEIDLEAANAAFDTTSAKGNNPRLYVDVLADGTHRLWLDLDADAAKTRLNILCVGDSITQGSYSTYGNWRVPLMKKVEAAGYEAWSKGFWTIESQDINGIWINDAWNHHAGISAQRIQSTSGGAGTLDSIEATLDQAGNVDFVLIKLGTNDINSNGTTAENLFPLWTNLVWKTLNQKPHAKVIAGAVVDIAYNAAKDEIVKAFNAKVKQAIDGGMFPAKRVYFADLYTACYRYDGAGKYIDRMFYTETNLHPDWYGEDRMAETYLAAIQTALAEAEAGWTPNASETYPATTGAENNVPSAFLAGYTRARVFDVAAHNGQTLAIDGVVPYEDFSESTAATTDISRVGYYIELKRKDDSQTQFNGLTRWMWVSLDAFNDRTIDTVGVPLAARAVTQGKGTRLRIATNMPGIESTTADANDVEGWIEFWPNSYSDTASGLVDAPANVYKFDWNDTYSDGSYGSMQLHRLTPGARQPAQVLFAFNRWTSSSNYEIGLGNFSHITLGSMDWTFSGDPSKNLVATMAPPAYEVAKIEIWTMPVETDPEAKPAESVVNSLYTDGDETKVEVEVTTLGTGATSATVKLEWSSDPEFGTVAGESTLGTVTVAGKLTGTMPTLGAGTWYYRVKTENDRSKISTSEVATNVWRPTNAAATWSASAWAKNGVGAAALFTPAWATTFDGTEATPTANVNVDAQVTTPQVTVAGSADYTFTGTGTVTAERLVKEGTGTTTLDSAAFAETKDFVIKAGTVKLGNNATSGALGKTGGKVTVEKGAQFDLNYTTLSSANDLDRAKITNVKKFYIAGAGPDGKGAIVNNAPEIYWSNLLSDVYLTDDATIGGTHRIDFRATNIGIHGPTNVTLTLANTGNSGARGVNMQGKIDVGKVVIASGSCLTTEGSGINLSVPYGIDLYGTYSGYGSSGTWNVGGDGIKAMGENAAIVAETGTSSVGAPLTVPAGGKLTLKGGNTVNYTGATIKNAGTIDVTAGTHKFLDAVTIENEGNPLIQHSVSFWSQAKKVTGDSRIKATGGYYWMGGDQDYGDSALAVSLSGAGSIVLGQNDVAKGLPKFAPGKLTIDVASGHTGHIFYHNNLSSSINGPKVTGLVSKFYVQGPTMYTSPARNCASNAVVSATDVQVGTTNGYGEWTFAGEDTELHATTLNIGSNAAKRYQGSMTVTEGLLGIGTGGITTGWHMPQWQQFVMVGGTLKADGNFAINQPGMTASFGTPKKEGAVTIDLNGKTVNWQTGLNGASDVTIKGNGTFGGGRRGIQGIPTGKWTVESTGSVGLQNAAGFPGGLELKEGANVTLGITGTNLVELLTWTWHDNAWQVFKPLATAATPAFSAAHVATSLEFFNAAKSKVTDVKHGNGTGFNAMGEFYVSAEQAGTWWFANNSTTHNGIIIDGTEYSTAGYAKGTGPYEVALTEGWHKFTLSFYSNGASEDIGPQAGKAATYWFKVGGAKGTWPGDYTRFDVDTVPMRMRSQPQAHTSARFRKVQKFGDSVNVYTTLGDHEYTTDDVAFTLVDWLHTKYATGVNAPCGGCASRWDGFFYVPAQKAGRWNFKGKYDDRIAMDVDGRRLFTATSNGQEGNGAITLDVGWHAFTIYAADSTASGNTTYGSGGYLTDSHNNVTALEFAGRDGVWESFDERYLNIAMKPGEAQKREVPGLSGRTVVAAGATLTNTPALEGGYCPISGTLAGEGVLSGAFRFIGEDNCWEVAGSGNASTFRCVQFGNADDNTLAGLKKVKATFQKAPGSSKYVLSEQALGLTAEKVAALECEVKDASGNDYSETVYPALVDGKFVLRNSRPSGVTIFFR